MEKFGIFELLDALSALTAVPPEEEQASSALDSAYLPPDYPLASPQQETSSARAAEQKSQDPSSEPPKTPRPDQDALAGFYARHNAVAKKAGKK